MFQDRRDAGLQLADKLIEYANKERTIILALPRGGVPVALEVADKLHLPLDVLLVCKIGIPGREETAMGAIANGEVRVLNQEIIDYLKISPSVVERVVERERQELERRNILYRNGQAAPDLSGWDVIVIDDGIATGATMQVAVLALREQGVNRIIVAAPVSSKSAYDQLVLQADQVVVPIVSRTFAAVSNYYRSFSQVSDREVKEILTQYA
jgi:putative phosphoribosyl transferase